MLGSARPFMKWFLRITGIGSVNTSSIDLNLLRTFVALMEERNVSAAGRRLNLSQPATSNALERLRGALDDRVLERRGRTMVPTRTATALYPAIRDALGRIDAALSASAAFDPASLEEDFSIGIDEYSMALFGRALLERVGDAAPKSRIAFHFTDASLYDGQLGDGTLDLVVGPLWRTHPGLERTSLYDDAFVGLMCADHPLAGRRVTPAAYVRYPHLLVSARGFVAGNVDAGLQAIGRQRRVGASVAWLASAPALLEGSELLLNVGSRLAERFERRYPLRRFAVPVKVPGFRIAMLWHPRHAGDARHAWLRDVVAAAVDPETGA